MKKLRVYIDTSVISHLQADDAPGKMEVTHNFWKFLYDYECYISELVIAEIASCPEPKKSELEDILQHAPLFQLEVNQEVLDLADRYMSEGLFPSKYLDDAIHVALATAYGCDVLVSWNFKHMVKLKTIYGVNGINKMLGYAFIDIVTPEFLVGEEESKDE